MGNSLPWVQAATPLTLADRELHVWRASLNLSTALFRRINDTLNADERERAEKFLIAEAREHFIAARGILRQLLGMYLGLDPQKVEFRYGPQGKPSLSESHNSRVRFSVSHSQALGLFALASGSEVGVDIEQVKPDFKGMQIASHFFSEAEIARLAKLSPEPMNTAFFECWTGKEAYVKARGEGLSLPLRNFSIGFVNGEQALTDETGRRWSSYSLEPAAGFAGAVVAAGEGWTLRYLDWTAGAETETSATLPT
jgi:4'-phosphopantetheinyl transferase